MGNRKQKGGLDWPSWLSWPTSTTSTTEATSTTSTTATPPAPSAPEASWWSPFSLFYSPKPSVVTNDKNTTDASRGGKKHKKSVKKSKGKKHQKSAKR